MGLTIRTISKSSEAYNQDIRVRQIDELQRIALAHRAEVLGQNWFSEVKDFYNLSGSNTRTPTFRPKVVIPQLQLLSISEATDLSDSSPRIYIQDRSTGKRAEGDEIAFQQEWKDLHVNYQLMHAILWSQLASIGWMMVGYDPFACGKLGSIWAHRIEPENVAVDPGAMDDDDWTYVVLEDRLYPDQVRYNWPETGQYAKAAPYVTGKHLDDSGGYQFQLPLGPMQQTDGLINSSPAAGDGKLRVRYCFINDRSIEAVNDQAGADAANKLKAVMKMAYPNGRLLVGAGLHIVADGDNPTPTGVFPLVPIYGLPALTSFYPPAPIRFSKDLQDLAGRMLTQTFENAVRVNNAVWFIDESTGINADTFGGIPGEVQIIAQGSKPPEMHWPAAFPDQYIKLPMMLLALQKELQGFSESREGSPGAGNISVDLFEASIFQSKRLSRCRARLLARSVQKLAKLIYLQMRTSYSSKRYYGVMGKEFKTVEWTPSGPMKQTEQLYLDPNSLLPVSQAALRQIAPMLRQEGAIDVRSLLRSLEIPDADGIADAVDREMQLKALANQKRR